MRIINRFWGTIRKHANGWISRNCYIYTHGMQYSGKVVMLVGSKRSNVTIAVSGSGWVKVTGYDYLGQPFEHDLRDDGDHQRRWMKELQRRAETGDAEWSGE